MAKIRIDIKEKYEARGWYTITHIARANNIVIALLQRMLAEHKIPPCTLDEEEIESGFKFTLYSEAEILAAYEAYKSAPPPEGFIGLEDYAKLIGYSRRSVSDWAKDKDFPPSRGTYKAANNKQAPYYSLAELNTYNTRDRKQRPYEKRSSVKELTDIREQVAADRRGKASGLYKIPPAEYLELTKEQRKLYRT